MSYASHEEMEMAVEERFEEEMKKNINLPQEEKKPASITSSVFSVAGDLVYTAATMQLSATGKDCEM